MFAEGEEEHSAEAEGDGQIDAAFRAIEKIAASGAQVDLYSVRGITEGSDSQGDVSVRLKKDGLMVTGRGADTDIVVASVKAYLNALGRLQKAAVRAHPQRAAV